MALPLWSPDKPRPVRVYCFRPRKRTLEARQGANWKAVEAPARQLRPPVPKQPAAGCLPSGLPCCLEWTPAEALAVRGVECRARGAAFQAQAHRVRLAVSQAPRVACQAGWLEFQVQAPSVAYQVRRVAEPLDQRMRSSFQHVLLALPRLPLPLALLLLLALDRRGLLGRSPGWHWRR